MNSLVGVDAPNGPNELRMLMDIQQKLGGISNQLVATHESPPQTRSTEIAFNMIESYAKIIDNTLSNQNWKRVCIEF